MIGNERLAANEDYPIYEAHLIQRWVKICQQTHKCCTRQEKFLPTRLIDVGTTFDPTLLLVLSADVFADDYIALSHCWDLTMPETGRTTSKTLERHKLCIRAQDLPLTFRDFVGVARRLGIRHVWIDSLCIIQDSREDWEKEAAQMADVYSNAIFTVAASASADGRGGCHVHDDVRSFGPVDFEYPVDPDTNPTNADLTNNNPTNINPENQVFRLWSRDTYPVGQILGQDPLMKRGWTLQERELSPRVIHYSRDTIRWECCELRATIEFPWGDYNSFDVGRLLDGGSSARPTLIGGPHNDSKPLADVTKEIVLDGAG